MQARSFAAWCETRSLAPDGDGRRVCLDFREARTRRLQEISNQRGRCAVGVEVEFAGRRTGGASGLDIGQRHQISAQQFLVAHRAVTVLVLELLDGGLRWRPLL